MEDLLAHTYGVVLFLHVVFAIVLVGGGTATHLAGHWARSRATTVGQVRGVLIFIHGFSRIGFPIAGGTLLTGLYLAFDGAWWGLGWPIVSLVLLIGVGAAFGTVLDPAVGALVELADTEPDGPVTPALRTAMHAPRPLLIEWTAAGIDLAIVFLMTNKPGLLGSVVIGGVGIALGFAAGKAEVGRHRADGHEVVAA